MKTLLYNLLTLFILTTIILSCGEESARPSDFEIRTSAKKNAVKKGETISISLKAKKNTSVDSVSYSIDGVSLGTTTTPANFTIAPKSQKLGHKELVATVYTTNGPIRVLGKLILLNNTAPKILSYQIVNTYPHQIDSYTQGLEFDGDDLYESAGQYGKSKLRKVDYLTGEVQKEVILDNAYFAEGLTLINNNILQLTWKENTGFIYNKNTFEKTGTFAYSKSREGWGLCNDGATIYKSDGTSKIWTLNSETLQEETYIEPTDHTGVKSKFNELEYIKGKIYANTYQVASIAIIDPATGAIEGIVDLRPIVNEVQEGLDKDNEVLNGIAYKSNEDRLFVTGKHWNTLFEIKIEEK